MATTPLTVEVITPALAAIELLLMILVEVDTPLTTEVKVLIAEDKAF